jgi:beta-lactamase superfamily II metal-dependent hydrolase
MAYNRILTIRAWFLPCVSLLSLAAQSAPDQLRIYAIDVEGGKSTLYVSPSGESMLIDTGYAGNNNRDAQRIAAAAKAAGILQIDHLVITHYHGDHAGGVAQLAAIMPIGVIYDHGDNFAADQPKARAVAVPYLAVRKKFPHKVLHAGDTVPVRGLDVRVVAASGNAIGKPLPDAGQANPLCGSYRALEPDTGENALSIALLITFGSLRIADFGDLYWNQEYDLACPKNKVGTVDLYMTTHHGTKTSGNPQILQALGPKVAIMNNGPTKGGSVKAWKTIHDSPRLQDIWQLHTSKEGGKDHNAAETFIANPGNACNGYWIEVSARQDGVFTVRNSRNQFAKTYAKQ